MLKARLKKVIFKTRLGRTITKFILNHHNRIQFIAYEGANAALAGRGFLSGEDSTAHTFEALSAVSFAAGSGSIAYFDFKKRPSLLMWGGGLLTLGGVFLSAAGYPMSGIPVAIASAETMRGGYNALEESLKLHPDSKKFDKLSHTVMSPLMKPYKFVMEDIIGSIGKLGKFLDERPFVSGTLIKSPPRLTFIYQKAIEHDWLGMCVGISWLFGGDGGLLLNDEKLKNQIQANLDAYE